MNEMLLAWVVAISAIPVESSARWQGHITDSTQRTVAPEDGVVVDATRFAQIWNQWRSGEKIPSVDFGKEIVFIALADGSDPVRIQPAIDDDGDLQFHQEATTESAADFSYVMFKTLRTGIRSIRGVPLDQFVDSDIKAIADSTNRFALALYGKLRASRNSNLVVSPLSIAVALNLASAGASGRTCDEMRIVLHASLPEPQSHSAHRKLLALLNSSIGIDPAPVRIANRLWCPTGFDLLPQFLQIANEDYAGGVDQVDFKRPLQARKLINAWIEAQTERRISELVGPNSLTPDCRLVITNAIHFKARWTHIFQKSLTSKQPFFTVANSVVQIPTMQQTQRFRYADVDHLQILELPYGMDGNLSMLILLPKKRDGLFEVESRLTSDNIQKWTSELETRQVEVHLPRFQATSQFNLDEGLRSLGMVHAYSDQADFSRINSREQLRILSIIHKAFVGVTEEETEAAAATSAQIALTAVFPRESRVTFRADHPFTFLIRDDRTQAILFIGRYVGP